MTTFCVQLIPMQGDLLATTDPDTGVIYIRDDATPEEVGHAVVSELTTHGIRVQRADSSG